jgi:thiamine-monophosphate kinase
LPEDWTEAWLKHFSSGLAADQREYGVTLLGGDTTRAAGGLTVAITAIGRVPKGKMVLRSGARPGDIIFVTGTIGDGALGLLLRKADTKAKASAAKKLIDRYLLPQPRIDLGRALVEHASAAMDVSDGLVGDLAHICEASGVGAEIGSHEVPLCPATAAMLLEDPTLMSTILNGGDDYEILATVPEASAAAFEKAAEGASVPVTRIGKTVAGKGPPVVRDFAGKVIKLTSASHTHF